MENSQTSWLRRRRMTTHVPTGENGLYDIFFSYTKCISFLEIQDCVWDNISRLSLYLYVSIFPFPSPLSLFVSLFMCFDLLYLSYIFVCTAEGPTCIYGGRPKSNTSFDFRFNSHFTQCNLVRLWLLRDSLCTRIQSGRVNRLFTRGT